MDVFSLLLLIAYGSLVLELVVFPIPSEASTYQLFFNAGDGANQGSQLSSARRQSAVRKLLTFFLPTALGVVLFLIPLAAIFYPALISHLLPLELLQTSGVRAGGALVVVVGRLLTFASVLQLRRRKICRELQPSGLFSRSRNPGLVGMYLFYLGICLYFPCVVLFVGFVPYVLNMHQRVLLEESHLLATLGDGYRTYLSTVPRYLFFKTPGAHGKQ